MLRRTFCTLLPALAIPHNQPASSADHIQWVSDTLIRMQSINPGMTRANLLTVFKTEGGLSTRLQRTYVSRDCPYFKVDVHFRLPQGSTEQASDPDWLTEKDDDTILEISRPYLQFSIMD